MSTALTTTTTGLLPDAAHLSAMLQFADTLLKSGLLPAHIKSPAAAFAIIQKGSELGVPPMYALSNIAVIQGKPTANAELMQALIYRDQGDDALRFTETNDTVATIAYKRRGWAKAERFSFSIEDAKRAGLLINPTWQKYPGAMLRARAISAVARLAFADSIGGLYTSEELGATVSVTSEGEIVVEDIPHTNITTGEMVAAAPAPQLAEQMATPRAYQEIRAKVTQLGSLVADLTRYGDLVRISDGMTHAQAVAQYKALTAAVEEAAEEALTPAL